MLLDTLQGTGWHRTHSEESSHLQGNKAAEVGNFAVESAGQLACACGYVYMCVCKTGEMYIRGKR